MSLSNANPNKAPNNQPPLSREERQRRIDEVNARRKREADDARKAAGKPAPGSREARVAEATAPGVVKPSKSERPSKIPASANLTGVDDTSTVTEGDIRDRAKAGVDAELDRAVAPKPTREAKDPNLLSVGDIARELNIDPKRARARLRATGATATEGRWPKVKRDSDEHKALVATLSAPVDAKATT